MLVLTRKVGESVVITVGGERIVVKLTAWRDGKARIGFTAGEHVQINREEVQDAIDGGDDLPECLNL